MKKKLDKSIINSVINEIKTQKKKPVKLKNVTMGQQFFENLNISLKAMRKIPFG